MHTVVLHLENGDVLEFEGRVVSSACREIMHDGVRSTVHEYTLYERADGTLILSLESYEKIRSRSHRLHFKSLRDAQGYIAGDADGERLVREMFGHLTEEA